MFLKIVVIIVVVGYFFGKTQASCEGCNCKTDCDTYSWSWYVPNTGKCSTNKCDYHGYSYRWCYTHGPSSWDYCETQKTRSRKSCCVINIKRERLLLNAAKRGNLDEVKEFLKSTYVDTSVGSFGFNSNHETPLIKAARLGPSRIDIVQMLLDHNANINFQARNGNYPLYVAALNQRTFEISGETYNSGNKDVVQLLLDRGANTTLKLNRHVCCGEAGKTACYWNYKVDFIIPGCDGCSGPGNYSSNPIGDIRACCTLAIGGLCG